MEIEHFWTDTNVEDDSVLATPWKAFLILLIKCQWLCRITQTLAIILISGSSTNLMLKYKEIYVKYKQHGARFSKT